MAKIRPKEYYYVDIDAAGDYLSNKISPYAHERLLKDIEKNNGTIYVQKVKGHVASTAYDEHEVIFVYDIPVEYLSEEPFEEYTEGYDEKEAKKIVIGSRKDLVSFFHWIIMNMVRGRVYDDADWLYQYIIENVKLNKFVIQHLISIAKNGFEEVTDIFEDEDEQKYIVTDTLIDAVDMLAESIKNGKIKISKRFSLRWSKMKYIRNYPVFTESRISRRNRYSADECVVGKHCDVPDSDFDADQLAKGVTIELEHTDDKEIALQIAKDHLSEIPDYYTRLIKMEADAKKKMKEARRHTAKSYDAPIIYPDDINYGYINSYGMDGLIMMHGSILFIQKYGNEVCALLYDKKSQEYGYLVFDKKIYNSNFNSVEYYQRVSDMFYNSIVWLSTVEEAIQYVNNSNFPEGFIRRCIQYFRNYPHY